MPKTSKRGTSKKHSKSKSNYTRTKSAIESNKILSQMKSSRNKSKKQIEYENLINEHGNFTKKILEYEAEKHPVVSISHAKKLKRPFFRLYLLIIELLIMNDIGIAATYLYIYNT